MAPQTADAGSGPNRSTGHEQQTGRTDAQRDTGRERAMHVTPAQCPCPAHHTTGITRQEAGSFGVGSMDRSSVSYSRDNASAFTFWEPGVVSLLL
jgi:hypothetical protein